MAFTCVHIGASWASHLGSRFRAKNANNETKKAFIVFVFWKVVKSCTAEFCTMLCLGWYGLQGVDTNFEKLETVGLPTHNFQEPQVKFRSPNLFLQFDLHHQEKAAGVL